MFRPTRQAALEALNDFLPHVSRYAEQRNFVRSGNPDVSRLSPYIRHRLITEEEVVRTVLARYPFERVEKFIQEVVWRTYWKGWLERNPTVWDLCVEREALYRRECSNAPWGAIYEGAIRGASSLSFFNDWVHELTETGYLHNHIRMWFASVWIFTLRIPWQLGAMFMYRNLLDGDPASNTLSWRWVAGLQTKGKSYLARAENISKYSEGRWNPKLGELGEDVYRVENDTIEIFKQTSFGTSGLPAQGGYGVFTTDEDLSVELDAELVQRAQGVGLLRWSRAHKESDQVGDFVSRAEDDALHRLRAVNATGVSSVDDVKGWVGSQGLSEVAIVTPAVGPGVARVATIAGALGEIGVTCFWYQRRWDRELYILADKGFFPFWERIKKRIFKQDPLFYGK